MEKIDHYRQCIKEVISRHSNPSAYDDTALFDSLLEKWGKVSSSEAERILDEREPAEPEADLPPELVSRLQDKIAQRRRNG